MAKTTKNKASVSQASPAAAEVHKHRKTRFVRIKKSYLAIIVLVLLIGIGGGLGYRAYDNQRKEVKRLSNPQESAKAETERIKSEVSELIELPADEDPTIATVVDSTKLSNQAFFAKAQNGDRVVMYAKAKKAVLYRPDTHKIIEVAPINLGDPKAPAQTAPAASSSNPLGSDGVSSNP